jgi:hypothetical protein
MCRCWQHGPHERQMCRTTRKRDEQEHRTLSGRNLERARRQGQRRQLHTNVQKVFENLKGSGRLGPADNEREVAADAAGTFPAQVGKYIHGVGDVDNILAKAVEGAAGIGLVARIVRGYTYLSRQYDPGDCIFITGFSRGAYTARALAGFVGRQGLLDWKTMQLDAGTDASYSAGLAAWEQYKSSINSGSHSILHGLADAITSLHDRFELGLHPAPTLRFVDDVGVCAVGVWDTVGALGIPDVKEEDGTQVRNDVFQFADAQLSSKVKYGFHAVAADEQRIDFTPTLWSDRDGVIQVLFPGAHADVGGGYPEQESGLSNGALVWMSRQLASVGVLFDRMPPGTPDPLGIQHRPWAEGAVPFKTAARFFPPGLCLSQRVLQRIAAKSVSIQGQNDAPYRPKNLINSYVLMSWADAAPHVQVVA